VVENGVSDERETFELQVKDGDPSGVRLTTQDADRYCDEPGCPPHATTVLLDDLLEVFLINPINLLASFEVSFSGWCMQNGDEIKSAGCYWTL